MAMTLLCNEENLLGLASIDFADTNQIETYPGSVHNCTYWHKGVGQKFNAKIIYDKMIAAGYTVSDSMTIEKLRWAYATEDNVYRTEYTNNYLWLIGSFDKMFGLYIRISAADQLEVCEYTYDTETPLNPTHEARWSSAISTTCECSTDTPGITETKDNYFYFVDYAYRNGQINPDNIRSGFMIGRYPVHIAYDSGGDEWYYRNDADEVTSNNGDTCWKNPTDRIVPYLYDFSFEASRSDWFTEADARGYKESPDPYKPSGASTTPDGGNGEVRESVDIPHPTAPPDALLASGVVKLYAPDSTELNNFIDFIYSSPTAISDNFKKIWVDPMQSIISLAIAPFAVPATGTSEIVRFCGVSTNVGMTPVDSQFVTLDCGSINLPGENMSNLDYASYTKIKVYLPFIGIMEMNTDDCMNANIDLQYLIDIFSGDCVATIKCSRSTKAEAEAEGNQDFYKINYNSVLYTFKGNCLAQLPISGNNYQQLYSGVLGLATTAMFNPTPSAIASSAASFVTSQKVSVTRSGNICANSGHLGDYLPYLIIECPIASTTEEMYKYQAYPMNETATVNKYVGKGYTVFQKDSIKIDIPKATDAEKQMIKSLLETGVIL